MNDEAVTDILSKDRDNGIVCRMDWLLAGRHNKKDKNAGSF